ncbi:MAG TPA: response regulator, partial [Chloroflexi bacterium]|nr:response regulator [Chloroflexota bacterium]
MRRAFRVLVVDDDEAMVRTLADILRMKGMEALTAFSAEQARRKILGNDIDCVICDVRMPDEDGVA